MAASLLMSSSRKGRRAFKSRTRTGSLESTAERSAIRFEPGGSFGMGVRFVYSPPCKRGRYG